MQRARIGAGSLQVHLVALDHQRLDALVRQPIGEAGAGDAAADHQRVDRLHRQRRRLARPRHVGRHEILVAAPFRLLDRSAHEWAPAWPAGAARTGRIRRRRPTSCAPRRRRNSGPGSDPCRPGICASTPPACRSRPRSAGAARPPSPPRSGRRWRCRRSRRDRRAAPRTAATAPPGSARSGRGCGARPWAAAPSGRDQPRSRPRQRCPAPGRHGRRRSARRRRWRRPRRCWCGPLRRSAFPSSRCRAARSDGRSPARAPAPTRRRNRSPAPRYRRRSTNRPPRPAARVPRPPGASPCDSSAAGRAAGWRGPGLRAAGRARPKRRPEDRAIGRGRGGWRLRGRRRHWRRRPEARRRSAGRAGRCRRPRCAGPAPRDRSAPGSAGRPPSGRPARSSPAPAATARRRRSPAPGAWAGTGSSGRRRWRRPRGVRTPPRPWPRSGSARRPAAPTGAGWRRRGTAGRGSTDRPGARAPAA